jgi:hypothetical protein
MDLLYKIDFFNLKIRSLFLFLECFPNYFFPQGLMEKDDIPTVLVHPNTFRKSSRKYQ